MADSENTKKYRKKIFFDHRSRKLNAKKYNEKRTKRNKYTPSPNIMNSGDLFTFLNNFNFKSNNAEISRGVYVVNIPPVFSLIRKPNETLEFLMDLFSACQSTQLKLIHIDHVNCVEMDLSASTLLDIILMEAQYQRGRNLNIQGVMRATGYIKDMLNVSGIVKHLGFPTSEESHNSVKYLSLMKNGTSSHVATEVAQYINDCLGTQGFGLNRDGLNYLSEMVSEVVDNCSIHPGYPNRWYTIGHYYKHSETDIGECQLSIISYGKSIYESIKDATDTSIKRSLERLSRKHAKKKLLSKKWTEESLYTLYALQEGISRLRSATDPDRGTGTIKLISHLESIGYSATGKNPEMTILSGHTNICFNGKYRLRKHVYSTGEERYTIFFNARNSPNVPPDSNCVQILENNFPGTAISMKFYIDRAYIKDIISNR